LLHVIATNRSTLLICYLFDFFAEAKNS